MTSIVPNEGSGRSPEPEQDADPAAVHLGQPEGDDEGAASGAKGAEQPDPAAAQTPAGAAEDRPGFDLGGAADAPKGEELKGISTVPIGGGEAPLSGSDASDPQGEVDPGTG